MEYNLSVSEETTSITIKNNEPNSFLSEIDNKKFRVTHRRINDHTIHMTIESEKQNRGVTVYHDCQ